MKYVPDISKMLSVESVKILKYVTFVLSSIINKYTFTAKLWHKKYHKTLKYFEEILKEHAFARIHKSFLVNVNAIVKYKKGKGGSVVVSSGKEILVSSSKKANLLSYFK